jgi:hypothetical protein
MSTVSENRTLACPQTVLEDTGRPAEARDPDELAEAINRLPVEDYRKLLSMLRTDYSLSVPYRRAISCAVDAVGAEAAADLLARFRRNVAITRVSKMVHLKVQDVLFLPRISGGGIASMGICLCTLGVRNEPKSC